ncbi:hypothetical protein CyaNS01_00185 [Cyanobium sp. NS01]|nr:hypothetical protein CyaNS01_00185 [Cyanobium sp. NS01]
MASVKPITLQLWRWWLDLGRLWKIQLTCETTAPLILSKDWVDRL